MKKIFKYFGVLLSVALMGAVTACNPAEIEESADIGLGIKVFFPTKVVTGQPMTINGSGFSDVREIVFPDGVTVSSFELVSGDMIRVTAPSGISAAGGKLIVRTADDEAESRQELTLGSTAISGYSKQEGETVDGGEQITIFGKDLEFISRVELLDTDGNPLILEDEDFYRKGTSTVVFTVPKKTIFDGTFIGKVYTFDGREFSMPELTYVPAAEEGGHWETVETVIWANDGSAGEASWNGIYRFGLDGHDGNNECIATFPQEIWDRIKGETFYATLVGANPQVRITTGWWTDPMPDIQPGNELLVDNGDGTWTLTVDLSNAAFLNLLDDQHLLFTGSGYSVQELYFEEEIWVDGGDGGPKEIDIASFTMYQDRSDFVSWPFFPSWSDDKGKWRIMRGGDPAIESLGLTTSSKFIVYKEVGTTGQIQWNNPNWQSFAGIECNDWEGSAETIEVPVTEDMLKCINGEITDGWSDTCIILQGDGLKVNKIVIVP